MSRFFFALSPDKLTKDEIIQYRKALNVSGKLINAEHLHITLIFLGKLSINEQQTVIQVANNLRCMSFNIISGSIGVFNNNILWLGLKSIPEPLRLLHKQLSLEIQKSGISVDTREYKPHITLIRKAMLKSDSVKSLLLNKTPAGIHWQVNEFILYESIDTADGVQYQKIKSFSCTIPG